MDKNGRLIDFMLLKRRNIRAAYRFLSKATANMRDWPLTSITTGKLPSYPESIDRLHLYLTHGTAMLLVLATHGDWHALIGLPMSKREITHAGLALTGVYLLWTTFILVLYLPCFWLVASNDVATTGG